MENHDEERDIDSERKKLIIFGRDVSKIPCFRSSCLYGFSSGIISGLLTFMFTSRVNLSSHIAVGSGCAITLGYFAVCRYQFAKDELLASQVRLLMNEQMLLSGAERDEIIERAQKLLNRDD